MTAPTTSAASRTPDGRITSLTVNANNDLVRIVTPELCTTSLVYDATTT